LAGGKQMKTVAAIEKTSRQVILAGLGVVGLGKDYAIKRLDMLMDGFNEFVNELLIRGEEVDGNLAVNGVKDKVFRAKQRRIDHIRKQLGLGDPSVNELDNLTHKVDELTKVINKLAEQAATKQTAEKQVKAQPADKKITPATTKGVASRSAPATKAANARKATSSTAKTSSTATASTNKAASSTKVAPKIAVSKGVTKPVATQTSSAASAKAAAKTVTTKTAPASPSPAKSEAEAVTPKPASNASAVISVKSDTHSSSDKP